jgi:transcriptional regulator with XRE-family HTH domain
MVKKVKSPEIVRLKAVMAALGIDEAALSAATGVSERTITNYTWSNKPIGNELLRALLNKYRVSLDWLLAGVGSMFLQDKPLAAKARRLIAPISTLDNGALADVYLLTAGCIEQSLIDAGAVAGEDYAFMDLYRLAQAHVLQENKKNSLEVNFYQFEPQ